MTKNHISLQLLPLDRRKPLPWRDFGRIAFTSIANLSHLNGMTLVPSKANLLKRAWLVREARASSEIEGLIATIEEIEECRLGISLSLKRKRNIRRVLNYQEATRFGFNELKNGRPFSIPLLKSVHALLSESFPDENKTSIVWRTTQVNLGNSAFFPDQTSIVLPDPIFVGELMENWEDFSRREDLNPIIQAAVLHAQFMMIQPFSEDNGRIGRLSILLFLAAKNILINPCFFLSSYLLRNRDTYYASLAEILKNKDWNTWISFFLNAVAEESEAEASSLLKLADFYETSRSQLAEKAKSSPSIEILDCIFEQPVFTAPSLIKLFNLKLSKATLLKIIQKLKSAGRVNKLSEGRGRRPTVWKFGSLVDLLQE